MEQEASAAILAAIDQMQSVNQTIAQATVEEEMVVEVLKQLGPALGAVLAVVWLFMKHLNKRDEFAQKALVERDAVFLSALKEQNDVFARTATTCHEVQERALDSIDKNTAALAGLKTSQESTELTLREVRGALERAAT